MREYVRRSAKNIATGKERLAQAGHWTGGKSSPFGYDRLCVDAARRALWLLHYETPARKLEFARASGVSSHASQRCPLRMTSARINSSSRPPFRGRSQAKLLQGERPEPVPPVPGPPGGAWKSRPRSTWTHRSRRSAGSTRAAETAASTAEVMGAAPGRPLTSRARRPWRRTCPRPAPRRSPSSGPWPRP
jgi:hypothetical protein